MDSEHRKEEIELKPHEIASKTVTPTHTIDWYIKYKDWWKNLYISERLGNLK